MRIFVVVLAGGAGTRFWPAGRRARPKQLLSLAGGQSLLAETLRRCVPLAAPEDVYVITNEAQAAAALEECPQLAPERLQVEPAMRNTAAAIGLGAIRVREHDPEGVMVVLPADHFVRPDDAFLDCIRAAARRAADADALLTIGVRPTGPATGYGYIESGEPVASLDHHTIHRVASFTEKPDAATAARFIASGSYFWNAGMFVWRVGTVLDAFARHLPAHLELLERLAAGEPAEYESFENVPIDRGILERADNVEVIPASFQWDDIGSWLAIDRLNQRDEDGNVVRGTHVGIETKNCIVMSRDHLVATLGLEDLIVVHTPDATLICPKERAEEVRYIAQRLREEGLDEYL